MKKYLLMLCCAAVCAGFVGCSDDDDEGASVEPLVGRWSCYRDLYTDGVGSDEYNEYGDGKDLCIFEFHADGTGGHFDGTYLSQLDNENNWARFTYTLKGSQLTFRYDDGFVGELSVEKINSSELVMAGPGEYAGVIMTERRYFRRMK